MAEIQAKGKHAEVGSFPGREGINACLKKEKTIAVLMPVYNPLNELNRTLASLRRQTVHFKLIVVDDGSTNMPDYEKLLSDFDYVLIKSDRNLGVNEARNPGLQYILEQNFDFIALIDCGDEMAAERLEVQSEYLDKHPEIALLGSWIRLSLFGGTDSFVIEWPLDHNDIVNGLWSNLSLSHPSLMLRREIFLQVGLYSGKYPAAEDYDLVRRVVREGFTLQNMPQVLTVKHESTSSTSWMRRRALLLSRLRIQWEHRNLVEARCVAGLAKTVLLSAIPHSIVLAIKAWQRAHSTSLAQTGRIKIS